MKYGESILVFDGEKWNTVLFVEQNGSKVKYRSMNGYGRPKTCLASNVRDIYECKGDVPRVKKGNEERVKWKHY